MAWYQYVALAGLMVCLVALGWRFLRLIRMGAPKDHSRPAPGSNLQSAILYAFSGSMGPRKKESAYLHLPTYAAGLLYHSGTFLSFALFAILLFSVELNGLFRLAVAGVLAISSFCGAGILVKRLAVSKVKALSHPDDYLSNILVTGFHLLSLLMLVPGTSALAAVYFLWTSLLFLYIPLGKLKHMLYFFAARYHLGAFYGRRGVWPPVKP